LKVINGKPYKYYSLFKDKNSRKGPALK